MDSKQDTIRVLGVDPGLNVTGYGVIDMRGRDLQIVEAGVVRGGARGDISKRVGRLYDGLEDVIKQHAPQLMALEELYSHYQRPRTAILMGHARGVICLAAAKAEIPVYHYASTQVKRMLTGNGRASKKQMQLSVAHEFGLPAPPDPPDVADALAIAMCHCFFSRQTSVT